jgi:NAD-dependent deacetylase
MNEKLKDIIRNASNVVFFGGAGVSTESKIPDFRSSSGLYTTSDQSKYTPEEMLSHNFFKNHTEDFFKFYKSKMLYPNAMPNAAHLALATLENHGVLTSTITQNIDGLHQMAGSRFVIELHGSVHRNYCVACGATYDLDYVIHTEGIVPTCSKCGGIVRPDVVLYQESLNQKVISDATYAISNAEVLIVGGTSLVVYPASGLLRYFKGERLVLINKASTDYDNRADLVISDSIGKTLSEVVDELYGSSSGIMNTTSA